MISAGSVERAWATFVGLEEDHPAILALTQASQTRRLVRGARLLEEADNDTSVFLIASGTMRTVRHTPDGQEVWFTDAPPGELIGEMAALTGQPRTSSVTAKSKAVVYSVERPRFLAIARAHGEVGLAVATLLAHRLVRTSTQVADLVALNVQNRLHRELARLAAPPREGDPVVRVNEPPSVTQLGQRIHATREATSRALRDLETRGLIAREGHAWLLIAPEQTNARD